MIKTLYPFAQKWSERGSVYLYSDTHFDDHDCRLMDSNWPDPQVQVDNIRAVCHKNDTLLLLGDVGNPEYLKQLKCYKVLIAGNHDPGLSNFAGYFDEMYSGPLFISDRILLSHEPFPYIPYVVNIHGHDHNGMYREQHYNVCSNVIDYCPINLGKIIKGGTLLRDVPTIHRYTIDCI